MIPGVNLVGKIELFCEAGTNGEIGDHHYQSQLFKHYDNEGWVSVLVV